jgi:hypothetical protein
MGFDHELVALAKTMDLETIVERTGRESESGLDTAKRLAEVGRPAEGEAAMTMLALVALT